MATDAMPSHFQPEREGWRRTTAPENPMPASHIADSLRNIALTSLPVSLMSLREQFYRSTLEFSS